MNWTCNVLFLLVAWAMRSLPLFGEEIIKSGSGFHPNGYILTNNHVVAGSREQTVVLSNGTRLPAKIIATDPEKDLALLKIEGSNYPTLPMGRSRSMTVMDTVLAMGLSNPVAHAGGRPDQYVVTYRTGFELGDRRDEVRGTSDVTVVVQDNDGTYRIVSVQENVENNGAPCPLNFWHIQEFAGS